MKNFFDLNRSERNGLLLLITLCFLIIVSPAFYYHFTTKESVDFSAFESELAKFRQQLKQDTSIKQSAPTLVNFDPNTATRSSLIQLGIRPSVAQTIIKYRSKGGQFFSPADLKKIYGLSEATYEMILPFIKIKSIQPSSPTLVKKQMIASAPEIQLFNFDPNTISVEQLQLLGIPDKTARIWGNFRKKGGRFYRKEEVAKIYGLTKEQYLRLAPFIQIEKHKAQKEADLKQEKPKKSSPEPSLRIDINQANQEDWQQLRGIGPYRAKGIIKFREQLGGFSSIAQVAEVYTLPDSVFQSIAPYLILSSPFRLLHINHITQKELAKHPYLSYKEAQVIINYRKQHGRFSVPEDLGKIKIFSPEKIKKLSPYLNFD